MTPSLYDAICKTVIAGALVLIWLFGTNVTG